MHLLACAASLPSSSCFSLGNEAFSLSNTFSSSPSTPAAWARAAALVSAALARAAVFAFAVLACVVALPGAAVLATTTVLVTSGYQNLGARGCLSFRSHLGFRCTLSLPPRYSNTHRSPTNMPLRNRIVAIDNLRNIPKQRFVPRPSTHLPFLIWSGAAVWGSALVPPLLFPWPPFPISAHPPSCRPACCRTDGGLAWGCRCTARAAAPLHTKRGLSCRGACVRGEEGAKCLPAFWLKVVDVNKGLWSSPPLLPPLAPQASRCRPCRASVSDRSVDL